MKGTRGIKKLYRGAGRGYGGGGRICPQKNQKKREAQPSTRAEPELRKNKIQSALCGINNGPLFGH